jgi:hypothetical protein
VPLEKDASAKMKCVLCMVLLASLLVFSDCKKSVDEKRPEWAKKDIRDFSDADMERLLDQWDVRKIMHAKLQTLFTHPQHSLCFKQI